MVRAAAVVVLGLSVCAVARGASFNCSLAKTVVERAICSDPNLSAADTAMAATYKQVMGEAPIDVQTEIRDDQRVWVRSLAVVCKSEVVEREHTAERRAELVSCLKDQYKNQTAALQQKVKTLDGVVFVTRSITLQSKDAPDDNAVAGGEENPGYGTLNATWPEALSKSPEWVAWNAAVLLETQKMAAGDDKPTGVWKKEWAAGIDADVTATVDSVRGGIVSVSVANDFMGHGAAHPGEMYETFPWVLAARRRLRATDVVTAGSGWEKVMDGLCRASLKAQVGDDYDSYAGSKADFAKTLHDVIVDPANWTLDAQGVTIDFPEYSVTPRAEPADPVLVPWSALRGMLAKGFVVPR